MMNKIPLSRLGAPPVPDAAPAEEPTIAVLSHAPMSDLDQGEQADLFEIVTKFRAWCRKHGYKPDVRALPPDPEGHAERRRAKEGR